MTASHDKPTVRKRVQPLVQRLDKSVSVIDANDIKWRATGKDGLSLRVVREDPDNGLFLGAVGFETYARSGLHQHQGIATSFFASGGISDYAGSARQHDTGINFKGSTHDAIAYEPSLLISRLEGPVVYPDDSGELHGLHIGARHGEISNQSNGVPPEINIPLNSVQSFFTEYQGVKRKTLFDYASTQDNHRMLYWSFEPASTTTRFKVTSPLELWIHAGDLTINGQRAHANCFVVIEADLEIDLASSFGALLIAWTDTPPLPGSSAAPINLFGY